MNHLETLKQARDDVLSVADFAHKTDVVIGWAERIAANLTSTIEQLEKAEPVAWMDKYGNMGVTEDIGNDPIPLYAHPAAPVIDKSMLKRLVTQVYGEGYTIAAPGEKK